MSTHKMQFHDELRIPKIFVFLSYFRVSKGLKNKNKHGKEIIYVRVEALLYL